MKRNYRLYQSTSKRLMSGSSYTRLIVPKGSTRPSHSTPRSRGGAGSLINEGLRAIDNFATYQESAAVKREVERQRALLEPGEQKTLFIEPVRKGVFDVQGKTKFTKPGDWNGPQIKSPDSKVQRVVITRLLPDLASRGGGESPRRSPGIRVLPADANFDRSYRDSIDRGRNFDSGYDHVSPSGGFRDSDRDTAWA